MAANNDHIVRSKVLPEIEDVERRARDSWRRLETQHGCESGAARAFENGRLSACADLRLALGLPAAIV